MPCGCRNLCHQVIFVSYAPARSTALDPEMVQVGDVVGQWAQRGGLSQGAVWPVGVAGVFVLSQDGHQVPLVPDQGPVQQLSPAVGFLNSAVGVELVFYAARSYSLMRPPRTGRRLICAWERSATG